MALNVREQAFVKEYIINKGNAYQAAIKAGYAQKTARVANEWLSETRTNSDKKRHLPYKPELRAAIDEELKKLDDAKIADEKEVLQYLTSVMRKESRSQVIVIEGTGEGRTVARLVEKPPDEKEATKAAELLGKVHGAFTERMDVTATVPVFSGEDDLDD